jgi:hypothetical protein
VVESAGFTARFEGPFLASVRDRRSGVEFLRPPSAGLPLQMSFVNGDELTDDKHQTVTVKRLSDTAARVIVAGADSDRELLIRTDEETGDLCVKPAGQTARRGVVSVRWSLDFARETNLVLPCVNGMLVESGRAFPGNDRFTWPCRWNAQLVIAEREGASLMVHSEDTACTFKALRMTRGEEGTRLGFESESPGPLWENRNAGGVEWRLNTYAGNWRTPAGRYRDWLRKTYDLEGKRRHRPEWVNDIAFAVQWCSSSEGLLDALASLYPPRRTLIHLSNWRTSKYDVDYPDYFPSEAAEAFMRKANAMGFRVMPHFNFFACYNEHALFSRLRDWQIRNACRNEPEGWYWPPQTHDYTRMAYIHPGLALWRRTLIDAVREACSAVAAPAAFLDQTLCTWNADNGIVENMTTVEGMRALQDELAAIQPDLVLAGEGMNEISYQRECFGQAHIHDGWDDLSPHHVEAAHPVCSFLWEGHTRLVGYYHLTPEAPAGRRGSGQMDLGIEIYRRMGAIPTLIPGSRLEHVTSGHPLVKRLVELAGGG